MPTGYRAWFYPRRPGRQHAPFANEIGALAGALGIDGGEVMATLAQDTRLNASAVYQHPGFAFGGSCLPKDVRTLNYRSI